MSSQSYAVDAFVIPLKDKSFFIKMGLEKEHSLFLELMEKTPEFPSSHHLDEIDELLSEGIVPQNENGPDVIEAYLMLVDAFADKYIKDSGASYPELMVMRDDIEGVNSFGDDIEVEPNEIYWGFSRSDLFVQTPTPMMSALKAIGAEPKYNSWTEYS